MAERLEPDLCVIGAGSGGLTVAAVSAQFGVPVVLIERGRLGGDCLNFGCVPSKALLAAAKRAQAMRSAGPFGMAAVEPDIDPLGVHAHVRRAIASIQPNDSIERFTGLGVRVIQDEARFIDKRTVQAGNIEIRARRFVIATGSSPSIPPLQGLDTFPYLTNETIFEEPREIERLIVIGGGPIGLELAQAYRRLGSEVAVIEVARPLAKDDPELAGIVLDRLIQEGVDVVAGARIDSIGRDAKAIRMELTVDGRRGRVEGSHILVATGRRANVDGLGLVAAGVKYDRGGVKVTRGLKTSNSRIYAIGDVAGGLQFTHVANYHAGIVLRNALFRLPAKVDERIIPWVTYTDPELAHVGLQEAQARERHGKIEILRWPYSENDRAHTERATTGFIKVIAARGGRILGASIVGEHAGEIIHLWALAIAKGLRMKDLAAYVAPYPTFGEVSKRVAQIYYAPSLTSWFLRRIIKLLRRLG